MGIPHRPTFSFGDGPTVLTPTWPAQPYEYPHSSVGGMRRSAAGVAASYAVRRDRLLAITLRVLETERTDVEDLIEWGQGMEYFDFKPDADEAAEYSVDLEEPAAGASWQWQRDTEFPHLFTVRLVLRKADGSQWTDQYHT